MADRFMCMLYIHQLLMRRFSKHASTVLAAEQFHCAAATEANRP